MKNTLSRTCIIAVALAGNIIAVSADSIPSPLLTLQNPFPEQTARDKKVKSTRLIGINVPDSSISAARDSAYKLIDRFYADQFRNFQDPNAPYFMFMSKNGDLAMGVGGLVRIRGWFDWNRVMHSNGFSPYLIPMENDPTSRRLLGATPAGTGFFITLMAHKPQLGYLSAYIEGNFDGYKHQDFKLKKAYVTLNDFTIGYATSTMSDPAAQAPVIDGAGANGKVSRTNVLVRYLHTFKGKWSVGGSVEFPQAYVDEIPDQAKKCADYVPDIAAMAQYQWDGGLSHIRVSGLLRVMPYRNLIKKRNCNVVGWGALLSGMWKVYHPLTLYASASVGQGFASYQADMSIENYDLVGDYRTPGEMYAPTTMGITAGLKYNFRYNVYLCGTFGMMRYFPKQHLNDDLYKQGMYGCATLFWDITPRIQCGIEYLAGRRLNFNGRHAGADRIDALFQFSF